MEHPVEKMMWYCTSLKVEGELTEISRRLTSRAPEPDEASMTGLLSNFCGFFSGAGATETMTSIRAMVAMAGMETARAATNDILHLGFVLRCRE